VNDLRVVLLQLAVQDGEPGANRARALQLLQAAPGADLYLLPELWTTGYAHSSWPAAADRDTPETGAALQRAADARRAAIGGTLLSRDAAGRLVNRFWLFAPGRAPVTYDKGHLFAPMQEDRYLAPGHARVRAPVGGWTTALSICFDLRFPEMYRLDALAGAEVFLVPSEWPAERADAMQLFARARAAENQAFLLLCNRAGAGADGTLFGGGSLIVRPDGAVQETGPSEEAVLSAVLEGDAVSRLRSQRPLLPLRRAGLDW